MTKALLSLGSNLGDRLGHLQQAIDGFGNAIQKVSPMYETPPWPPGYEAPSYLNAAVLVSDDGADAYDWLERALSLEKAVGRVRDPAQQYAPRTLDIDVVMVWGTNGTPVLLNDQQLIIPHPRARLRAFVLKPWHDIQPSAELPGHGPVSTLLQAKNIAKDLTKIQRIS